MFQILLKYMQHFVFIQNAYHVLILTIFSLMMMLQAQKRLIHH